MKFRRPGLETQAPTSTTKMYTPSTITLPCSLSYELRSIWAAHAGSAARIRFACGQRCPHQIRMRAALPASDSYAGSAASIGCPHRLPASAIMLAGHHSCGPTPCGLPASSLHAVPASPLQFPKTKWSSAMLAASFLCYNKKIYQFLC